jgi:hypothetical protein
MEKCKGYANAKLVSKILGELYKKYTTSIALMADEETETYYVSFRYLNSLPEEFPTELLGVKIVTEQRGMAYALGNEV